MNKTTNEAHCLYTVQRTMNGMRYASCPGADKMLAERVLALRVKTDKDATLNLIELINHTQCTAKAYSGNVDEFNKDAIITAIGNFPAITLAIAWLQDRVSESVFARAITIDKGEHKGLIIYL